MKIFLILVACIGLTNGELPKDILQKCDRTSSSLEECIVKAADVARPILVKGIPEYNVPSLEPFKMDRITFDTSVSSIILKGEATRVVARGGGQFQIKKLKIGYDTLEATILIPRLDVTAHYDTNGSKMMLLKVDTTGSFQGTFNDVVAYVTLRGKIETDKHGIEHARVFSVSAKITFGSGSTINVIPDTKSVAAKMAANLINKTSANKILTMLGPAINDIAEPLIKKYINRILSKVPLKEVLY